MEDHEEEEQPSSFLATKRYAVVTGANRGIGFEICRQLASKGVIVVLTARDERKGLEAIERLKDDIGISGDILFFHRLDVMDPSSISSLADFVESQFGRLDILVNNAGIGGITVNTEALRSSTTREGVEINWKDYMSQTYEMAIKCLETNYYGVKRTIEALIPFLHLSNSPRIVNVSSTAGKLQFVSNEWAIGILGDEENLSEERVDEVLREFLRDFEADLLEAKGWPSYLSAYTLSKAAMNAYTRIMAKRHPNNFMINSVCPGYVKTNSYAGLLTVQEGAVSPVTLALSSEEGHSGLFFSRKHISSF
ncbi:(+)-neomenthol dehydrogenase-like [Impatiens glandulifera]|uniref:(+)-neomenthol dehydrogenase-like n=1 Tax=Impatiens glandulifera TaxID=253017 RepID=UPI001FB124BB|nr:(+)-neomenthol dehydrogenase-like [Impatiens glandulifera]